MKKRFSGSYGLLIVPDQSTREKTVELAGKITPDAEYKNTNPHITLFHARFKDLPASVAKDSLAELKRFKGTKFTLEKLQEYGGKFLFWDVDKNQTIMEMHRTALEISSYFDREELARAQEEGLKLSGQELENIQKYGYPLVNELYLPHITISWRDGGISQVSEESWTMIVEDIVFAEVGDYGSLKQVVDL